MSFRSNLLANYVSQIYVTVVGIVMVPLYVRYMGAEAYGLVGFFAMLQAWFQLLDLGLTPTMARETSRFLGGANDALSLRRLLRTLEGIFVAIAVLGAAALVAGSGPIAHRWLNAETLPPIQVQQSIILMAIIVALRWVCGLYRGAISGFDHLVWLSGFNILMATGRFVLVIPFLIYVGASPTEFFCYQLGLAGVEVALLVLKTYRLLPKVEVGQRTRWQWGPLRGVLKFSISIAFTSSVWVFVTQTDKLVLSKVLSLTDYAYFTLAVLMASGVMVISGPISGALVPRLSKLCAEGDDTGLVRLYRDATQLMAVVAIPTALVLAFFSEQVLWAWTGNAAVTRNAAPVLTLYAVGNGILALAAFPYYLQFAKGDLKLHLIGNALFVLLLIPAVLWATLQYGVIGAGYAWLGANAVYFVAWVPKVHHRLVVGLHAQWLRQDIGGILLLTLTGVAVAHRLMIWPQDRVQVALLIAVLGLVFLAVAALGSPLARARIRHRSRLLFSEWVQR